MQDKEVDGRAIKIKVAINSKNTDENGAEKVEGAEEPAAVVA